MLDHPHHPRAWHRVRVHRDNGESREVRVRGVNPADAERTAEALWLHPERRPGRVEYVAQAAPLAGPAPLTRPGPTDDYTDRDEDGWFSDGYDAAHQAHLDALAHTDDDTEVQA